jgi:hypothetical protein
MRTKNTTSPAFCQACGKRIVGTIFRFDNDPESAFCSLECQISMTKPVAVELKLVPLTAPLPPLPVYTGTVAMTLHADRGCECGVFYANQITVPKRHSVICFCPKCGCVTVD